jgi:hypothetical protein
MTRLDGGKRSDHSVRNEYGHRSRRRDLLRWITERPEHEGLTASEIVDLSGIYDGHGRADRCFDDLKALEREGAVLRYDGRPAQWGRP